MFGTWLLWLSIILRMSSSQLTNSILFQRGWLKPPTSYHIRWLIHHVEWFTSEFLLANIQQPTNRYKRSTPGKYSEETTSIIYLYVYIYIYVLYYVCMYIWYIYIYYIYIIFYITYYIHIYIILYYILYYILLYYIILYNILEQICRHLFVGIVLLSYNRSMAALFWMFWLRPLNTCTRSCECQDGSDASAHQFSPIIFFRGVGSTTNQSLSKWGNYGCSTSFCTMWGPR